MPATCARAERSREVRREAATFWSRLVAVAVGLRDQSVTVGARAWRVAAFWSRLVAKVVGLRDQNVSVGVVARMRGLARARLVAAFWSRLLAVVVGLRDQNVWVGWWRGCRARSPSGNGGTIGNDDGMSDASGPVVRSEPRPGLAQLTLNRPDKLNAMTGELVQSLHEHLDAIAIDPDGARGRAHRRRPRLLRRPRSRWIRHDAEHCRHWAERRPDSQRRSTSPP